MGAPSLRGSMMPLVVSLGGFLVEGDAAAEGFGEDGCGGSGQARGRGLSLWLAR